MNEEKLKRIFAPTTAIEQKPKKHKEGLELMLFARHS